LGISRKFGPKVITDLKIHHAEKQKFAAYRSTLIHIAILIALMSIKNPRSTLRFVASLEMMGYA